MMTKVLFDTSAYLALINGESGSEIVQKHIANACISTVNIAEVVTYLIRNGYTAQDKINRIVNLIQHIEYGKDAAIMTGKLVSYTKAFGLSLGDRACLSLAKILNIPVYTADKNWSNVAAKLNVKVIQIR